MASFDPATGVKIPEVELCHSEKVDRAMETWAEKEAGYVKVSTLMVICYVPACQRQEWGI